MENDSYPPLSQEVAFVKERLERVIISEEGNPRLTEVLDDEIAYSGAVVRYELAVQTREACLWGERSFEARMNAAEARWRVERLYAQSINSARRDPNYGKVSASIKQVLSRLECTILEDLCMSHCTVSPQTIIHKILCSIRQKKFENVEGNVTTDAAVSL